LVAPFPRPFRIYFWVLAAAALTVQLHGVYGSEVVGRNLSDFGRLYFGVLSWREGGSLYAPNEATPLMLPDGSAMEMRNVASPLWHVTVLPFIGLNPIAAFSLWVLANFGAWLCCVRVCVREWPFRIDLRWCPLIVLALLGSRVFAAAFYTGQYVGLLMVPATLAWQLARRGHEILPAMLLGSLAAHKPFALLFVASSLWQRNWRAAASGIASFAGTLAVGVVCFGLEVHRQWVEVLNDSSHWIWLDLNASLWAPFARAMAPSPWYGFSGSAAPLYPFGIGIALTALGAWSWQQLRHAGRLDDSWAALWCCALLASPLGWTYYLWLGLGPIGATIHRMWGDRQLRKWVVLLGVIAVLPLNVLRIGQPSAIASFTVGSLYSWALLLLLWLVLTVRKESAGETALDASVLDGQERARAAI
jgi:hypothetical protein